MSYSKTKIDFYNLLIRFLQFCYFFVSTSDYVCTFEFTT